MKPQEITAPFIDKKTIYSKVDEFKKKYNITTLPVDIEDICEFDLGISFNPIAGLKEDNDIDAFISHSFKEISIDSKLYMDDRYQNRLRFSLAHEIGHLVLHKNFLERYALKTKGSYIKWFESLPQKEYGSLEYHANEFAGRLLVPYNDFINYYNLHKKITTSWNIITNLAREFGVSQDVIERRMLYDEDIKSFLKSIIP